MDIAQLTASLHFMCIAQYKTGVWASPTAFPL